MPGSMSLTPVPARSKYDPFVIEVSNSPVLKITGNVASHKGSTIRVIVDKDDAAALLDLQECCLKEIAERSPEWFKGTFVPEDNAVQVMHLSPDGTMHARFLTDDSWSQDVMDVSIVKVIVSGADHSIRIAWKLEPALMEEDAEQEADPAEPEPEPKFADLEVDPEDELVQKTLKKRARKLAARTERACDEAYANLKAMGVDERADWLLQHGLMK